MRMTGQNTLYKPIAPKGEINRVKHFHSYEEASLLINDVFYLESKTFVTKKCYTDGELSMQDVNNVLKPLLCPFDTFLDVGSGLGLVVFQLAMTSNVRKLIGIEPIEKRMNSSAFPVLHSQLAPSITGRMIFFSESLETAGLGNATVVYCCNVLFLTSSLLELTRQIMKSKQLHTVVSYIELDDISHVFEIKQTVQVVVSWTSKKVDLFIYKRPARRSKNTKNVMEVKGRHSRRLKVKSGAIDQRTKRM